MAYLLIEVDDAGRDIGEPFEVAFESKPNKTEEFVVDDESGSLVHWEIVRVIHEQVKRGKTRRPTTVPTFRVRRVREYGPIEIDPTGRSRDTNQPLRGHRLAVVDGGLSGVTSIRRNAARLGAQPEIAETLCGLRRQIDTLNAQHDVASEPRAKRALYAASRKLKAEFNRLCCALAEHPAPAAVLPAALASA